MSFPVTLEDREYQKFVANDEDETCVRILGQVSVVDDAGGGTKWREIYTGSTIVGAETAAITFTVGVGLTRQLSQLNVSCFRMALIKVKHGSTTILSGRTGPGNYNLALQFLQVDPILSGENVTVTFEGFERASDIEMYLSGTETT